MDKRLRISRSQAIGVIWLMFAYAPEATTADVFLQNVTISHDVRSLLDDGAQKKLRKGPLQRNMPPLPDLIPFFVDLVKDDKVLFSYLGFRGWDINKDGNVDMVEALNESGQVIGKAFDFNFDGYKDFVSKP